MITNLPGCQPMKPGAASLPMFGVRPIVVDPTSGTPIEGNGVEGVLCVGQPWPGIARSIWGDHGRYMEIRTSNMLLPSLTFARLRSPSLAFARLRSLSLLIAIDCDQVHGHVPQAVPRLLLYGRRLPPRR